MRYLLAALMGLQLGAPGPAQAAPEAKGSPTACTVRGGWSSDPDPAGLNVRAAPSAKAPIVGKLPPPAFDPDWGDYMYWSFDILEGRDGWFHIGGGDTPDGWVSGRYVGFALQTDKAFEAPDPTSRVVASGWFEPGNGIRQFSYRHPSECRGRWMKLKVTDWRGIELDAWVRGVCNMQETSCDGGAEGDHFDEDEAPVPVR